MQTLCVIYQSIPAVSSNGAETTRAPMVFLGAVSEAKTAPSGNHRYLMSIDDYERTGQVAMQISMTIHVNDG